MQDPDDKKKYASPASGRETGKASPWRLPIDERAGRRWNQPHTQMRRHRQP